MPPKKRKSGEGAAPKGKAAKKDDLMPAIKPDSMRMPHMKIFDAWMRLGLVRVYASQRQEGECGDEELGLGRIPD